jgi:hypothetical protein
MRSILRTTALAALLVAVLPAAQAATQSYAFNGTIDSGSQTGESFSGQFSFDDAALGLSGEQYLGVDSLDMSFLGAHWGLGQLESGAAAEVKFVDGVFAGLSYAASLNGTSVALMSGTVDTTDAYLAYTPATGFEGDATVIYAPVPEPQTYAMLLAGMAIMGTMAARRRQR